MMSDPGKRKNVPYPDLSSALCRSTLHKWGSTMIVLGIGIQHDAGAALIADGRILAAVNEERLNRKKLYWGWPERAIPEVLRLAGVHPEDLSAVAVANTTNSTYGESFYPKDLKRRALIRLSKLGLARPVGGTQLGIRAYRTLNSKQLHVSQTRQLAEPPAFMRKVGKPHKCGLPIACQRVR